MIYRIHVTTISRGQMTHMQTDIIEFDSRTTADRLAKEFVAMSDYEVSYKVVRLY